MTILCFHLSQDFFFNRFREKENEILINAFYNYTKVLQRIHLNWNKKHFCFIFFFFMLHLIYCFISYKSCDLFSVKHRRSMAICLDQNNNTSSYCKGIKNVFKKCSFLRLNYDNDYFSC